MSDDVSTTRDEPVELIEAAAEGQPIGEAQPARRQALIKLALVGGYLVVVFGILLPNVVDYSEMLDAFQAAPTEWLLVTVAVGVLVWVTQGLALKAVMPGLGVLRSVAAYLAMTAVGNTIPGPVKYAFGYRMFRDWGITPGTSALALSVNSLATQAGKLLLPAVAIALLTATGTFPGPGFLIALLLALPVAIASLVGVWVLRSEEFARRVGALATRATETVMRRVNRPEPEDLTGRLLDFRASAAGLLRARAVPTILTQLLALTMGYVLMVVSMRAVGVTADVLPPDVILGVYAVVMVITLLPIAPGGAGLPELLYISFFTQIVADPSQDQLIAAGVMLSRGMSWFLPIPVGYVVLYLHRRSVKRQASRSVVEPQPMTGGPA